MFYFGAKIIFLIKQNHPSFWDRVKMSKELTSRAEDYSQWYNDLVIKGGLADYCGDRQDALSAYT